MLVIHGGRTRRLWSQLLEAVKVSRSEDRRCVLFVPEQYTLQAERDLIAGLQLKGFFDIDVYSPSRFVTQIFQHNGNGGRRRVNANGKHIAVARAMAQCKEELKYYARAVQRRGFVAQSGKWIANMKRGGVTSDKLQAYVQSLSEGTYRDKINDLMLLCAAYDRVLENKFVDGEDVLACAIENLSESGIVNGCDVFVYGFDIITDDFAHLLCAVTGACCDVQVYLVMDREEAPDGDSFSPVRDSAERLRNYLRGQHLQREWLWDCCGELDAPKELRYLEKYVLTAAPTPYPADVQNISLFEAATPYVEAQYIAQQVALLIESGVSPADIVVLCGGMDTYGATLRAVFSAYEIPHYLVEKAPLQYHGTVQLLLSALHAVSNGYRREDMLDLIKSGYAPLSEAEGWELENYIIRYGIAGGKWHKPFVRGDEHERKVPEAARARLSEKLLGLQDELREARTGADSLSAPLHFLQACGVYEHLLQEEERLLSYGLDMEVLRSRQVWARLIALFEQLHEIAGEMRIPGREMASLLEAGLIDNEIAGIPPLGDAVAIGKVGNLIPVEPHSVFLCGLDSRINDSTEDGLFSADEQETVSADMNIYLGMQAAEHDRMSDLDVWKAMSAPRCKLYLSYAQALQDGSALRPAQIIGSVRRLFPCMVMLGGVTEEQTMLYPLAPQAALEELGVRLRTGTMAGQWLDAWNYLRMEKTKHSLTHALLLDAREEQTNENLPSALARTLFHDRLVSVSRLESFAACPYQHFVQYGLNPQERKEWKLDPSDRGVFFHAAMERFTRALPVHDTWPNISRKECDQLMDAALQPLTDAWKDHVLGDSARAMADGKRYINICKRVAWTFTKGAKQSSFRPSEVEVAFGYPGGPPPLTLDLSDGSRVSVRGRIDRVDRFDSGESVYLRVVDYKSGTRKLDPARIYIGMQLQLLLYLEAVLKQEENALPAGAFYQWMEDPLVDQNTKANIESEIAKRLCLKGVMLSDVQVLEWMDHEKPPLSIEDVLKKDGTPKKGKLVCTLEELNHLIKTAHETAVRLTEEIRGGDIRVSPVADQSNIKTCQYCAFAGVCRCDTGSKTQIRRLPNMNVEDLLK